MYFSKYRANKKISKKRKGFKDKKRVSGGIVRFAKISLVIIVIIPSIYLMDRGYRWVKHTPYLKGYLEVSSVRVKGNHFIAQNELAPYLQRIEGRSILRADIQEIADNVGRHPWIKEVSVRREFPSTIFVDILERTPAVYVNTNGRLYLADEEGMILGDKTAGELGLPAVYGVSLTGLRAGEKSRQGGLLTALEIKRELNDLPWIDLSATGIEVGDRGQVVLHLKGYRVKLGRGKYKEKLQRFHDIARNLRDKDFTDKEIDLRFDNQVIVKSAGT